MTPTNSPPRWSLGSDHFWPDYVPKLGLAMGVCWTYRGLVEEIFVPCSETGTNGLTLGGFVWYKLLDRQPLGRFVLVSRTKLARSLAGEFP